MTRTLDVATGTWEGVGDCPICDWPSGGGQNKRPVVALEPGKILISGGPVGGGSGTNEAMIIDFNQQTPSWEPTASMNFARTQHNATL